MIITEIKKLKELKDVGLDLNTIKEKYEVEDEAVYLRKGYEAKADILSNEHAVISYLNTLTIDRDNEVVLPTGAVLDSYRKHPVVMWGHDYRTLPVGKNLWIKRDSKGLIGKTLYANTEEADKIYYYRKDNFPIAESIGFIPLAWESNGNGWAEKTAGWEDAYKNWQEAYKQAYGKEPKSEPDTIYTKWVLLEYSDVSVPSNPEALQLAISKGLVKAPEQELKSVIPYKNLGKEDEGYKWDAGAEVKAATIDDLKIMATWYDKENPDIKGSYKLPHHTAKSHKSVWAGVSAAMAALLGARGGVNIPEGDRKGVYNHLAKHYKEYDKPVPDFKEADPQVLDVVPEKQVLELEPEKIDVKSILEKEVDLITKKMETKLMETFEKSIDKLYGKVE